MRDLLKRAPSADAAPESGRGIVPDVLGDSEEVALEKLRLSGFRPGPRREAYSRTFVPGSVIRTVPKAGTTHARGERVTLVVARRSSVPDVQAVTRAGQRSTG